MPTWARVIATPSASLAARIPTPPRPLPSNSARGVALAAPSVVTVTRRSSPSTGPAPTTVVSPRNLIPETPPAPRPWTLIPSTGVRSTCPSEATSTTSTPSGAQNAAVTRSPVFNLMIALPLLVPRISSGVSRLTVPASVTSTSFSAPSATTVWMVSPRFVPKVCAALAPRPRPRPSASSAASDWRTRPSEVTALIVAVVRVNTEAASTSWRPGVARRPPSVGKRPICPEEDKVTTHGLSATSSATSVGSKVSISLGSTISVRRGRPKCSTALASSSITRARWRFSDLSRAR